MSSFGFRCFIGLGNPGQKYYGTRHNIGFMAIQKFAKQESVNFEKNKKLNSLIAQIGTGESSLRLLMPNTFMNESGQSVRACLDWFEIPVNKILVLVDDMDLPLGKLRLREKGGAGGHNGLKNIINHLNTENFYRLRIGIGAPTEQIEKRKELTISHVLGNFNKVEKSIVNNVLDEVIIGLNLIQKHKIERVATRLNSFINENK